MKSSELSIYYVVKTHLNHSTGAAESVKEWGEGAAAGPLRELICSATPVILQSHTTYEHAGV